MKCATKKKMLLVYIGNSNQFNSYMSSFNHAVSYLHGFRILSFRFGKNIFLRLLLLYRKMDHDLKILFILKRHK